MASIRWQTTFASRGSLPQKIQTALAQTDLAQTDLAQRVLVQIALVQTDLAQTALSQPLTIQSSVDLWEAAPAAEWWLGKSA
jgi:hypothetical protein